jgi:anti-sigma-K factor RskA
MMSGTSEESGFERRARAVLEASLSRVDARTRSRLNRARQAALEAAAVRRPFWRSFSALPIAGAVAAGVLAVALTLFMHGPLHQPSRTEGSQPALEVLDMLADDDSIAFMENYDHSFYEWAAAQADAGGADSNAGQANSSDGDGGGGGASGGATG